MKTYTAIICALFTFYQIASAQISLDVIDIKSNQLTFKLTGTPNSRGLPTSGGGFGSFNAHQLRIYSSNQSNWITAGESYSDKSMISGNPMNTSSNISIIQIWDDTPFTLGAGGQISIVYDADLLSTDTGSSNPITITLPNGWNFVPENISSLSLSWGYLTVTEPVTTGAFQSSDSINPQLQIGQAVYIQFQSTQGSSYVIQESVDLVNFEDAITGIVGDGKVLRFYFPVEEPRRFYRLKPSSE